MATNSTHYPRPFKVKHTASAGQQLTGAASAGTRTWDGSAVKYAADAVGGLLDPYAEVEYTGHLGAALETHELFLGLDGNNTSWSIVKVDADGDEATWLSGTNEGEQFYLGEDCPPLLPGEKLKVVTAGCTAAIPLWGVFSPLDEEG